jgi:hypothetical protein
MAFVCGLVPKVHPRLSFTPCVCVCVCVCAHVCLGGGDNVHNFTGQNDGTGIINLRYSSSIALCLQTLLIYYPPMKYRPGFTWIQHDWPNGLS